MNEKAKSQRMVSAEAKEALLPDFKTVTAYANGYVGHPQEIDEDLSVYQKREAYKAGMNKAFDMIRHEINLAAVNNYNFPILHLYDFMDKAQGRKEAEK